MLLPRLHASTCLTDSLLKRVLLNVFVFAEVDEGFYMRDRAQQGLAPSMQQAARLTTCVMTTCDRGDKGDRAWNSLP